jgi:hypothetical protein
MLGSQCALLLKYNNVLLKLMLIQEIEFKEELKVRSGHPENKLKYMYLLFPVKSQNVTEMVTTTDNFDKDVLLVYLYDGYKFQRAEKLVHKMKETAGYEGST